MRSLAFSVSLSRSIEHNSAVNGRGYPHQSDERGEEAAVGEERRERGEERDLWD